MIKRKQIALGCMRISKMSVEEVESLILCAVENGVTLFDHADIYGNRKSEELFGEVLKRNPSLRNKIVIQSKCGICKGYYDLSKEHIIKQVEESVRLLHCDYLDVLLLHRPDTLVDYEEVNEAFKYLYTKGLVKSFGVSNMNAWQIALYQKNVEFKIAYNQVQFSLVHSSLVDQGIYVNRKEEEALDRSSGLMEYCQLNDIQIQAWSCLIASKPEGSFINHPSYPELNNKLEELAKKYNVTKNAVAIAWVLRHPSNIIPILGTTSKVHLLESLKALDINLTRQEWYSLYLSAGHILP